jgi:glycosyltransferase involved in cell wall biosynthesis
MGNESTKPREKPKPLRVAVLTPLGAGGMGGIDRIMDRLRIGYAGRSDIQCFFMTTRGKGHIALAPLFLAATIMRIVVLKILRRLDVAHINVSDRGSTYRKLIAAYVLRVLRIPYVVHLHGAIYQQFWEEAPAWLDQAIQNLFNHSARVIVLGSVWAELIRRKAPAATNHIVILPPATPVPKRYQRAKNKRVRIAFMGRLGKRKGVPQLIAALGRLADEPNWSATLTGDGEILGAQQAVNSLGIGDRVSVPGWVSDSEQEAVIGKADIFVLPSLNENLPLSLVEAFAHGVAVVCTPVGAVPDVVENGRTGLLVEPNDVDGLTAAIRRLLHDHDLRDRLGANARAEHVRRLEINCYLERLSTIWQASSAVAQ